MKTALKCAALLVTLLVLSGCERPAGTPSKSGTPSPSPSTPASPSTPSSPADQTKPGEGHRSVDVEVKPGQGVNVDVNGQRNPPVPPAENGKP